MPHPFKIPKDINIIVPAAPLTKLAFRGGGAKGAVYPGAIKALEHYEVLPQVDTVAGSSAGSIIALFVALGFNSKEIDEVSKSMNFYNFLDFSPRFLTTDRGICDGKILYRTIQKRIEDKVREHVLHLSKIVATQTTDKPTQEYLSKRLKNIVNKKFITFADLAFLKSIYKKYTGKNVIKDLVVTGTNITDNELAVFSAKSTPNMEVAKAIRISTSYPIIFKPVTYNGKRYMDGGAMDNLPVRTLHQFNNDKNFEFLSDQSQRQATLSFMLGTDISEKILHHGSNWHPSGFLQTIKMYLSNLILKVNIGSSYLSVHQAMHDDYGLRTIPLPTGSLSTRSFTMLDQERRDLNVASLQAVGDYFQNRQQEGVHYREKDFMSCLMQIDCREKNPDIYKYLARPFMAANPNATPAIEEKIRHYVKTMADRVFKLNSEKRDQARTLTKEVKNLISLIAELYELNEDKTMPGRRQLIQDREIKIKNGIREVQKLYENYLRIKDVRTGIISTDPRQREILNDRLQSQQAIFDELSESLAYYTSVKPHKKASPHYLPDAIKLEKSLQYFTLQRKKAQIIQILVNSKVKYFQRRENIKLLSEVAHEVRAARSYDEINKQIARVKQYYLPRTFFSRKHPSLFSTAKQLKAKLQEDISFKVGANVRKR